MEAKFTKGDWKVVAADKYHGFYVEDESGYTVADLYFVSKQSGVSVDHGDNPEANANLIAAAPRLYEALDNFDAYASTDVDYIGSPFQKEVRAALAKARGE